MKVFLKKMMMCCCMSAAVLAVSCNGLGNGESYLGSVSVTLTAPEGLEDIDFSALSVRAVNTADGVVSTSQAGADGTASISGLTAGSYNVSVSGNIGQIAVSGVSNGILVSAKENTEVVIELVVAGSASGLVIKEVFYSGHSYMYDAVMVTMYKDSFIELFNNSDAAISLDGLYIASLWSYSKAEGDDNPAYSMTTDPELDRNYVYADIVTRIPGNGNTYMLQPGKSFLIAANAINFKKELRDALTEYEMPVSEEDLAHIADLSKADLESYAVTWMQSQGRDGNDYFDLNNPDVPDMENIYYESTKDYFMLDPNGASVVIARTEQELTDKDLFTYRYTVGGENKEKILMKIPVSSVLDGIDNVRNLESGRWKCLPNTVDLGFGFIPDDDGGMTNYSLRRRIDADKSAAAGRLILMDTNNSSEDLEALDPPAPKGGYSGYDL